MHTGWHAFAHMQITVFKSRTDIALLQGQDEAARLEEELVTCKRKYEQVRALRRCVRTHWERSPACKCAPNCTCS